MAEYYILQIKDEFDTGIPMGYETGLIDEFNSAPEGATIVKNKRELNSLVSAADKADQKLVDEFDHEKIENPVDLQKLGLAALRKLVEEMGISTKYEDDRGRSRNKNKAMLIEDISGS